MKKRVLGILMALAMLSIPVAADAPYNVADISHYNNVVDWLAVKASTDGLYLKATEGVTYTDPMFAEYTKAAKQQNIPLGFYHFFWPWSIDNSENGHIKARQEADSFYAAIKGYTYQMLPVVDVEETNGCNAAQITDDVQAFCDELVRVDGAPGVMIYCSPSFADAWLSGLTKYPLWIAHYGVSQPRLGGGWTSWAMWQYIDTGSLPGISGNVDLDKATSNIYLISPPAVSQVAVPAPFTGDPAVLAYQQKLNSIQVPRPLLDEDGQNGPRTKAAVKVLETIEGLTVDAGIWGRQCNSAYSMITSRPTLKQGSTGQTVKYLQYRLGIKFDGEFGPQTLTAVKAFQFSHGLNNDGVVGLATWAALGVD